MGGVPYRMHSVLYRTPLDRTWILTHTLDIEHTQPEGGVEEGQVFLTALPDTFDSPRLNAPTGQWKDGICDFCSTGFCHSSLWCALCCTQIAVGQVMSRMQLTWLGEYGTTASIQNTFKVICILVSSFYVYSTALELAALPYAIGEAPGMIPALKFFGNFLFSVWALYSLCRTRENVRARYQIPEQRCVGCEDLCCSLWCAPCTTAQLMRHTGEYENYPGVCCSKTGHPPGTPLVV